HRQRLPVLFPFRCSEMCADRHSGEQTTFRTACARFEQAKGCEQTRHVFHNGYTRFAFQCLGVLECVASASFNKATMISGDELVCMIRLNSVGGIAVVIDEYFLNRLPLE